MKKQTIELTGVILLDTLLIVLPLYIGINQILVDTVGYILTVLVGLTLLVTLFTASTSSIYETMIAKRKEEPNWWVLYDILSDTLIAAAWWSIGWESVAIVIITNKLLLAIKYPEYYLPNSKENR